MSWKVPATFVLAFALLLLAEHKYQVLELGPPVSQLERRVILHLRFLQRKDNMSGTLCVFSSSGRARER